MKREKQWSSYSRGWLCRYLTDKQLKWLIEHQNSCWFYVGCDHDTTEKTRTELDLQLTTILIIHPSANLFIWLINNHLACKMPEYTGKWQSQFSFTHLAVIWATVQNLKILNLLSHERKKSSKWWEAETKECLESDENSFRIIFLRMTARKNRSDISDADWWAHSSGSCLPNIW